MNVAVRGPGVAQTPGAPAEDCSAVFVRFF